ncbi:MAG: translation initiation factor IF-2 [Patescibacteria group bacterium]|jgi:translation initiation factor IF-2
MNVSEIIRELKMTKDEFFPLVAKLGFAVGEHAIKVDDRIAVKLITAIKQQRKQQQHQSLFRHEKQPETAKLVSIKKRAIEVTNPITTKYFAELLGKPVTDVISLLVKNGIMATINQNLDFETVSIVAEDMGYTVTLSDTKITEAKATVEREQKLQTALHADAEKNLKPRPPVVVVMGHVDHGKTKLLDAIRNTDVVSEEAGGITQSIGAYTIEHKNQAITFIDTPGHEAFTAMRSRGANIADLAVLVIAADDGIKPQTIEAIEILEKAQLPFIVAINKIDKPEADIEHVKKQLSELNLTPEDWGGKTICVPLSAKSNLHINDLLDMILLLTEVNQDAIKANVNRLAVGTIIEARVDKDAGPVATVLIQTGTLKISDIVEVGNVVGKIRTLKSWKGMPLTKATPSIPVQFLGLKGTPTVGDILLATTDKQVLKRKKNKSYQTFSYLKQASEKNSGKTRLNIVLKADTFGSLEALVESLQKITHSEIEINIVKRGLGNFTEKDIDQAVASKAKLIGFNVTATAAAADYALGTQTTVLTFSIIYKLLEQVEVFAEELLTPEIVYNKLGELKVLAIFRAKAKTTVAGGKVLSGVIQNKAIAKIVRNGSKIGEATIVQLQSNKQDVSEVTTNNECGFKLETNTEIKVSDILEIYKTEARKRKLHD